MSTTDVMGSLGTLIEMSRDASLPAYEREAFALGAMALQDQGSSFIAAAIARELKEMRDQRKRVALHTDIYLSDEVVAGALRWRIHTALINAYACGRASEQATNAMLRRLHQGITK